MTFLGSKARGELTAPGIKEAFPLSLAANGDYYLDLVWTLACQKGCSPSRAPIHRTAVYGATRSSSIPGPIAA